MTAASFLVYPKHALGTNYIYMLYPPQDSESRHLLMVVATQNDTSVSIIFPTQFVSYIYTDSGSYDKGL